QGAGGAEEGGVAEGEDPSVGGEEVVALPARRGHGADDRPVEVERRPVAEEPGIAEGHGPAPAGEDPVAVAGRGGREADRPLAGVEPVAGHAAEGRGVAVGPDAAPVVEDPV